jgi:hypothetical protein
MAADQRPRLRGLRVGRAHDHYDRRGKGDECQRHRGAFGEDFYGRDRYCPTAGAGKDGSAPPLVVHCASS